MSDVKPMKHEEAITAAAHWYRAYFDLECEITVRSVKEDDEDHYYCELYSENVADSIGVAVYDDGRVEMLGEGIEYIKIRTFADPEPIESRWNGQLR